MPDNRPVRGTTELSRAFAQSGKGLTADIKSRLRYFALPVERDAEGSLGALGAGREWSQQRRGANSQVVYVAPVPRGTRNPSRKRRNFANRMLLRAMIPALERNRRQIEKNIDGLVARMQRRWERG